MSVIKQLKRSEFLSEIKNFNSHSKKLLGATFDKTFKNNMCPGATRKLNTLARLTAFMELEKGA